MPKKAPAPSPTKHQPKPDAFSDSQANIVWETIEGAEFPHVERRIRTGIQEGALPRDFRQDDLIRWAVSPENNVGCATVTLRKSAFARAVELGLTDTYPDMETFFAQEQARNKLREIKALWAIQVDGQDADLEPRPIDFYDGIFLGGYLFGGCTLNEHLHGQVLRWIDEPSWTLEQGCALLHGIPPALETLSIFYSLSFKNSRVYACREDGNGTLEMAKKAVRVGTLLAVPHNGVLEVAPMDFLRWYVAPKPGTGAIYGTKCNIVFEALKGLGILPLWLTLTEENIESTKPRKPGHPRKDPKKIQADNKNRREWLAYHKENTAASIEECWEEKYKPKPTLKCPNPIPDISISEYKKSIECARKQSAPGSKHHVK